MSTTTERWSNWSGSVTGRPRQIITPRSIEEVAQAIKKYARDGQHIRVAGAGHSFTPLVQTDDILFSLDELQGVEQVDKQTGIATVLAGTRLKRLGDELLEHGLAQENLGDIDVQSIAGAFSTGTHGSGVTFGTLATQLAGFTLITADGEMLECSPEQHPDIFKAGQVSLGALGVIVKMKLRAVPAYRLRYRSSVGKLADTLAQMEAYKQENRNFEFYWFPYTDGTQVKFLNQTDEPSSEGILWGDLNKLVLENGVYWVLSELCRLLPSVCKTVSRLSVKCLAPIDAINYSHRLFATARLVRFQEMEYNIPAQHFTMVFNEIRQCIDKQQFNVHFPLECRFVKADDIWLSPAYQRDSAYIAVHMYRGMPYQEYFQRLEEIFKRYQGRPHWGKMHTRSAEELAALYPRWHDFCRVRAQLDPQGVFLNAYLRSLFAVE